VGVVLTAAFLYDFLLEGQIGSTCASDESGLVTIANPQFEDIVREHYEDVFRFACSLCKVDADAKDLTQQAFLRFARKGEQVRDEKKVKSWLFTVLRNEFIDSQRKKKRFPHVEISPEHEEAAESDLPSSRIDGQRALDALHGLPLEFREPLALFFLQGYTYKEIGEILNIPIGTVMSRLSRGKARLKTSLSKPSTL